MAGQLHYYAPGPPSTLLSRAPYDQFLTTGASDFPLATFAVPSYSCRQRAAVGCVLLGVILATVWWDPTPLQLFIGLHDSPSLVLADYNPLIRDLHHNVLDAETQLPPHMSTGRHCKSGTACMPCLWGLTLTCSFAAHIHGRVRRRFQGAWD